jgi:acetylserotonin N-methyltransferase
VSVDITPPNPSVVLDLLIGFRRSKTLFAAVSLGVFDALAQGPLPLENLAGSLGTSRDGLERLLDACTGLGLLEWDGQAYANSAAAAEYLTTTSPRRLTGYIHYSNQVGWKLWEHLEDAVREGTHRWQQAYGWDGPIFSHFFKTDQARREFLMGMHGFGLISSPQLVEAFDLTPFTRLVDLGGATGHLAVAACQRYRQLRAVVFDLPEVAQVAREMIGQSLVADRIQVAEGDFFVDPLPQGDLYALARIVHDWTEPKIVQLLGRIYDQLPSGGAVLIGEKLLLEDKSGPEWAQMQNLNMLTCTEGKERTLDQYQSLLRQIGFDPVSGCHTQSPIDAVLALKP